MPNIRRTFPGSSNSNPPDSDDGHVYDASPGMGKRFRAPPAEEDDDHSEKSEEEEVTMNVVPRSGGKQLRPSGGKYLRPPPQEEDDDDDDEEEELQDDDDSEEEQQHPVRFVQRTGGKKFMRAPAPQDEEEEESSEEEDEKPITYSVTPRGGGKSLSRLPPPQEEDESSSGDEVGDEDEPVHTVVPVQRSGGKSLFGKQLRRPQEDEPTPPVTTGIVSRSPAGGKQLRRPETEDDEEDEAPTVSIRPVSRGKTLRRPEAIDDEEEAPPTSLHPTPRGKQLRTPEREVTEANNSTAIRPTPRGKQLRRQESDDEEETAPVSILPPTASRGKQLRVPAKDPQPEKKQAVVRSPSRGKQLRKPANEESEQEDDDEDEMDLDSDSDDEEFVAAPPKPSTRPRRGAKKTVTKVEAEDIGDDEISSDDEMEIEFDANNTEALIRDEKDRQHLESLPELEREAILADRFEELKAEQDMKKAIREAKRKKSAKDSKAKKPAKKAAASKTTKSIAATATANDEALAKSLSSRRESSRDRDKTGAKSKKAAALAALKEERKLQKLQQDESSDESEIEFGDDDDDSDEDYEEAAKPWQKKERTTKSKVSRLDQHKDEDDSGEDMDFEDDDFAPKAKKKKKVVDREHTLEREAALEDFLKVTIPRRRLARWCNEPFFQAAILECFVRLFIGEDDTGAKVYRLCEIIDVNSSRKPYKFPVANKNDVPVSTSKTIRLKFGKSERDFPMYLVSDTPPTQIDVDKYVATQKNNRLSVLTKRRATKLRRVQDHLVQNYTYTTEDIERNIEMRKKQGKSSSKLGSQQTRTKIAVQAAEEAVQDSERRLNEAKKALMEADSSANESELTKAVREAEKELEESKQSLKDRQEEDKAVKEAAEDRRRRLTGRVKERNWAEVNKRALEANQQVDREATKVSKETEVTGSNKRATFNPYARRRVKPKILWEVGQANDDDDNRDADGGTTESNVDEVPKENTPVDTAPALVKESSGKSTNALLDRHQFSIDEEGLAKSSTMEGILDGVVRSPPKKSRTRKGISLAEYLSRKEKGTL